MALTMKSTKGTPPPDTTINACLFFKLFMSFVVNPFGWLLAMAFLVERIK
jgi:hypothetical protein